MFTDHSNDPVLVTLALLVCTLASFTALNLGARARATEGRIRLIWWASGSFAMASAIWSMHFIAMLAFSMGDMPISYEVGKTLGSLTLAIVFSGAGTAITLKQDTSISRLAFGGLFMGSGIAAMHYLGMDAMRMAAVISYDTKLVVASIILAIAASTAALWLFSHLNSVWIRVGSAFVMCVAVAGMHYTGMAAASYTPLPEAALNVAAVLPPINLAYSIGIAVIIVSALGISSLLVDEYFSRNANDQAERPRKSEEGSGGPTLGAEHAGEMGVFARLKDYHRVIAVASVPLVLFLIALGMVLLGEWQTLNESKRIEGVAVIAPTISDLVHELQRERGASAGFVGQRGQGDFRGRLDGRRLHTDRALATFNQALNDFDVDAYDSQFAGRVADTRRRVGQLDATRSDVSDLSATVPELESYFTSTIASLLDIVDQMAIISSDTEISNRVMAYSHFLQAKEQTGVERAIGTGGFSARQFSQVAHARFVGLISQQEALLSTFRSYATAQHVRAYESTVSGHVVEEVDRMRAIGFANGYGEPIVGVTGIYWYDTVTAKIDLMKEVENILVEDLVRIAVAKAGVAQTTLILTAIISFLFLAGTAVIVFFIVRIVAKSVNENWRIRWEKERVDHLALVAEHTRDMVIIADREGRVEWVNNAFEEHTGYELSEIRGREPGHFLRGPKTDRAATDLITSYVRERKEINMTLQNYSKDGTRCWVDLTITPIFDENDELTNYISVQRDIGDRVRAQEALEQALKMLRKEKERYEFAVQASADGIWEWGLFTGSFKISDHFVEKLGYTSAEDSDTIGAVLDLIHPDDLHRVTRSIDHHLIRKTPYDVQFRLRHADGTYRWKRAKGKAVCSKSDELAHMRGNVSDVHELRLLTEKLQRQTHDLTVSSQQNEAVLDSVQEGICGIDPGGKVSFVNAAVCSMLGLPEEDIVGKLWAQFARQDGHEVGPGDPVYQRFIDAIAEGKTARSSDITLVHRNGNEIPIEYTFAPLKREDGEVSGAIAAFHDITKRKEVEAEREEAVRQLEQANQLKSEFLANMSHEIRTPMNGVLGMCQHLLRTNLDKNQKECAEVIQVSSRALLSLINSILDLSKIEAGLVEPDIASFSVTDLVHSVAETLQSVATEKGLALKWEMADVEESYLGDELRLRQVLLNLVGNALKFTDEGSVEINVSIDDDHKVHFEVTDTGPGIPAAQVDDVFGRFTQVDASQTRRHGGTGLGLAISKELVHLLGGEIGVRSVEGEGSTFWFAVSLTRDGSQSVDEAEEAAPIALPVSAIRRVLVAEDNEVNRMVVERVLNDLSMKFVSVETGAGALEELEKQIFDLVLMDLQMPVMTGDEAIRRIRGSGEPYKNIPIIVLTANAMKGVREEMLTLGANEFVTKPLDIDDLEKKIKQVLGSDNDRLTQLAS